MHLATPLEAKIFQRGGGHPLPLDPTPGRRSLRQHPHKKMTCGEHCTTGEGRTTYTWHVRNSGVPGGDRRVSMLQFKLQRVLPLGRALSSHYHAEHLALLGYKISRTWTVRVAKFVIAIPSYVIIGVDWNCCPVKSSHCMTGLHNPRAVEPEKKNNELSFFPMANMSWQTEAHRKLSVN